ncbi:MAG: hypothetical protein L3V56_06380 [Candidatus Magnetoovum sp. WYHC-5]|nr:hypothetical protein [Candidatus Magnetoovum sp. WYHC-5]
MIEKMLKLIFIAPELEKDRILKVLQSIGIVEIERYSGKVGSINYALKRQLAPVDKDIQYQPSNKVLDIYNFLKLNTPKDIQQVNATYEYAKHVADTIANIKEAMATLHVNEEDIIEHIKTIQPFGRFDKPLIDSLETQNSKVRFWFCKKGQEPAFNEDTMFLEIGNNNQNTYYMTFGNDVPMCQYKEIVITKDLNELELELSKNRERQNGLLAQIRQYAPYRDIIYRLYLRELDIIAFEEAKRKAISAFSGQIAFLQGWCPNKDFLALKAGLSQELVEIVEVTPLPDEKPPTVLINNKVSEMGTMLIKLYDTPSVTDWDPSSWVFFAFSVFFAMIIADGGYGLVLLFIMLYCKIKYKHLKPNVSKFINLSIVLSSVTVIYGLAGGGFFSLSDTNPFFGWIVRLQLFNTVDVATMINAAIVIGMAHVSIALILKGLRLIVEFKEYILAIANFAWITIIWVFYAYYGYAQTPDTPYYDIKSALENTLIVTLIIVFLTSAGSFKSAGKVAAYGFLGIYNGVQFFADIMSYLRLFALGMTSTLLAQTFNSLAAEVWGYGIFGMLLGIIIFVSGHTINIILSIMSGVIHGLRLNFLEWYRWCYDGDGRAFKPFRLLSKDST